MIITLVLLGASIAYFYHPSSNSLTGQSVVSSRTTVTVNSCTDGKSGPLYLRLLSDSGDNAIQGLELKASPAASCNGTETVFTILEVRTSNETGSVYFAPDFSSYWKISFQYSGRSYDFNAPTKSNETTHMTVRLPSGDNRIEYISGIHALYEVSFRQTGNCIPNVYGAPWSVTLGENTRVEPAHAPLPVPAESFNASESYESYSKISFLVANGTYQYQISPSSAFEKNQGVVVVKGLDVTVWVLGPKVSCTITTTHPSGPVG